MIRSFKDMVPDIHCSAFISEAAYVVGNVDIGEKSSVWPGAVVRGDFGKITVGSNTAIEDNCVVHTADQLDIGSDVIIGHSAMVHCRRIGDNCMIGSGAILLQGAEIGNDCLIAAGTLIAPGSKIPDRSLVMGTPGKIKERLTDEKLAELHLGTNTYANLAQEYKKAGL